VGSSCRKKKRFYHNNGYLSPEINKLRRMSQDDVLKGVKNAGPLGNDMNGPLWTILRELRGNMGSSGQRAAWEGRPEEMFAEFVGGAPRTELIRRFNPGANARPVLNNVGNASIDDIFKAIAKESHGTDDLYNMSLEELLGR